MAAKFIDLDDCYKIQDSSEDIVVNVTVGQGQGSSYSIFLGTELISTNAQANLGSGIKGKVVTIAVVIVDTLKQTNWTSVTVNVSGGGSAHQFGPYSSQAQQHLDTVIYTLKLIMQ